MARPETLQDWLSWQVSLHSKGIDLGLERVAAVWRRLGPEVFPCPVITVAGTNGKGSCVAMIEAMALAAGYRCASYTSPHLVDYNERVKLSGEPVSDRRLCEAFARVEGAREEVSLTYFEFGTLAALDLFARERPDLAVLEVGLGGRLDAVNIIDADVSLVTTIGHDHTAWLGESLDEIALEKAGIFRPGRPAVIGQRDAPAALRGQAERMGARPIQLGREMEREPAESGWILAGSDGKRLALPIPALRGGFQLDNAAAAITALQCLRDRLPVSSAAVRMGLQRALLPGRFQVIPGTVTWILDVAHNAEAAQCLASNLQGFQCAGVVRAVLAVLSDKMPESIAEPLRPFVHAWYLAQSDDARAMSVEELSGRLGASLGVGAMQSFVDVESALDSAFAASQAGDCVLVVGSFTTVGQALRHSAGI
ncbi:bifunctional tetrahydrofolate synthase/dihydrofolate synthase [Thiocystis violacea]|uniref:bifunctional tetrahydrofolate synthase/dihydrofolate synthase n=1 Tax=Thiocystis violacea TaxID=13725 RepID=UPI001905E167|nr:bifunctional tetrahydrofolate synthase/dihydrofolate synthase [Thiocystis violacea]MBK1723760.1 bifunctional tetrahydrofolate synthase/dihydrofolate synthase [Thiocystis violacea]